MKAMFGSDRLSPACAGLAVVRPLWPAALLQASMAVLLPRPPLALQGWVAGWGQGWGAFSQGEASQQGAAC